MSETVKNRYDFVLLFDVKDGNPNGDPDAGNLPRVDPETGHGLVTDVCLKRKVRNYIGLLKGEDPPYEIYVKEGAVLNRQHDRAWESISPKTKPADRKKLPKDEQKAHDLTAWMCKNFYDIRAFGAVMTTGVNAGQVRGPIQLTFARSVDQIIPLEHCITRVAITREEDRDKKEHEMGRKFTVPYGLYRCHGFVSAPLAEQRGFGEKDLKLFWEALTNMFEHDRSAARGEMTTRKLVAFKHKSKLGNAPAHKLFERVKVERKDASKPARSFDDYKVVVDEKKLPTGITILEII